MQMAVWVVNVQSANNSRHNKFAATTLVLTCKYTKPNKKTQNKRSPRLTSMFQWFRQPGVYKEAEHNPVYRSLILSPDFEVLKCL